MPHRAWGAAAGGESAPPRRALSWAACWAMMRSRGEVDSAEDGLGAGEGGKLASCSARTASTIEPMPLRCTV